MPTRRLPPRRPRRKPMPPKGAKPITYRRKNFRNIRKPQPPKIMRLMDTIFENKIIQGSVLNEVDISTAIQTGAQTYCKSFVMGTLPTAWNSSWWTSCGKNVPSSQNSASDGYNGNYVYLKNTNCRLFVNTNKLDLSAYRNNVSQIRIIAYRARRRNSPSGITEDPKDSLFINSGGNGIGWNTTGETGNTLLMRPVNTRNFEVVYDHVFHLENQCFRDPASETGEEYVRSGYYPVTRSFQFNFPHNRKVKLAPGGNPGNYDPNCYVTILASGVGLDGALPATALEVGCCLTSTTYNDN